MKNNLAKIIWIVSGLVALSFVVGLVIIVNKDNTPSSIDTSDITAPAIVNDYGAVLVDKTGVTKENENNLTEVHLYFDPICPGCAYIDQTLYPVFDELLNNDEIVMYVTPLSFLDGSSTDEYSSRVVSAVMTVGEDAPEYFLPYINRVFLSQPEQGPGYVPVTNEELATMAVEVGVPEEVANKIPEELYKNWAISNTENIARTQTDVFPNGISTPALFINLRDDNGKVIGEQLDFETELDLEEYMVEKIREAN